MPNHNYNKLTVIGLPHRVEQFRVEAQGQPAYYSDDKVPLDPQALCYNALVPVPPDVLEGGYNARPRGQANGVIPGNRWQVKHWGAKWEAGDVSLDLHTDRALTYDWYSPWGPPFEFLEKAHAMFADLAFFLSWGGEGPTRGRNVRILGEVRSIELTPEPTYALDDEEDLAEQYTAWRDEMLTTHDDWVAPYVAWVTRSLETSPTKLLEALRAEVDNKETIEDVY